MPIYEYECRACGAHLERLIRTPTDIPVACPKCNAKKIVKVFSSFSVSAASATPDVGPACGSCAGGACPYSGNGGCAAD